MEFGRKRHRKEPAMTQFEKDLVAQMPSLLHFAIKLTKNRYRADDLVQDTIVIAITKQALYTEERHFSGWISTIMKHTFINQYRKERKKMTVDIANQYDHYSVNNLHDRVNSAHEIDMVLKGVSERDLYNITQYAKGYKYVELAEESGLPEGTIKSAIFRARSKARQNAKVLGILSRRLKRTDNTSTSD